MGLKTDIEYADSTINEIRGCGGCELWKENGQQVKICYAGNLVSRWAGNPAWPDKFTQPVMFPGQILKALAYSDLTGKQRPEKPWLSGYPRVIFYHDMSDGWTEFIWENGIKKPLPVDWMAQYIPAMEASPHIHMMLTKRPRRAVAFFRDYLGYLPANFWLGTSITSHRTLGRAWDLLELPKEIMRSGSVLWLSGEPLYSDLDLVPILRENRLGWAAIGGESGSARNEGKLEWLDHIVADFKAFDVPIFVKQLGQVWAEQNRGKEPGKKGGRWEAWPERLKVRQMPRVLEMAKT